MDIKEFYLKHKKAIHQGTLEVLGAIPEDQITWRPAPGMLSLGEVARHIWMSEEGVRRVAFDDNWGYFEKRVPLGLSGILGEVKSLGGELAKLKAVHEETLSAVAAYPLERWEEERRNDAFNVRRKVVVMLYGITDHEIHHRAQVGAYLHLLTGRRVSPYVL